MPLVGGDPHTSDWVTGGGGGCCGEGKRRSSGSKDAGGVGCDELELVLADGADSDGERDWGFSLF